jgi:hypothetical protein
MNPIVAWLLTLALHFAPPTRAHQFPGWVETEEQRTARYAEIAQDIYDVVYDEESKPIPGMSRARTAAYMLALAIGESGLDPDADKGPCYREKGWWRRCDAGEAASMWQVRVGKGFLFDGDRRVRMKHLFAERKTAIRVALRAVRGSFWACRKSSPEHRLAVYGSGTCSNKAGMDGSADRYKLAKKLWGHKKIPRFSKSEWEEQQAKNEETAPSLREVTEAMLLPKPEKKKGPVPASTGGLCGFGLGWEFGSLSLVSTGVPVFALFDLGDTCRM